MHASNEQTALQDLIMETEITEELGNLFTTEKRGGKVKKKRFGPLFSFIYIFRPKEIKSNMFFFTIHP